MITILATHKFDKEKKKNKKQKLRAQPISFTRVLK
jgi:hypothetical protein